MSGLDLARMRAEWQASRRLRLGVLAALLFLGAHAVLALSDRRQATVEAYERDEALFERLREASRERQWPARAEAAEARLAEVRHSVPPARSDGLAQAELQAWLTDLAAHADMTQANVRVETSLPVPGQDGLWQVLARLDGNLAEARIRDLVRALAAARPWVQTERLELQAGQQPRASLVVRGYFRAADELDASQPPPRPAGLPPASRSAPGEAGALLQAQAPAAAAALPAAATSPAPATTLPSAPSLAAAPSGTRPPATASTGSARKAQMRAEARARAAERRRQRQAREQSP
ncbi:MAG TPA: hypothetical protein VGC43_01425 [Luteimonas sp.]